MSQEGVQVLVSRDLAQSLSRLQIDLKKFLFLRHLKASVELRSPAQETVSLRKPTARSVSDVQL